MNANKQATQPKIQSTFEAFKKISQQICKAYIDPKITHTHTKQV